MHKSDRSIVSTLMQADQESTAAPYWLILDPSQNMACDVHYMAGGITGPFFCREDAAHHLEICSYNFSKKARVYCMSGHRSLKYRKFYDNL